MTTFNILNETLNNVGLEGSFLSQKKGIYKKYIYIFNIILNGKN